MNGRNIFTRCVIDTAEFEFEYLGEFEVKCKNALGWGEGLGNEGQRQMCDGKKPQIKNIVRLPL